MPRCAVLCCAQDMQPCPGVRIEDMGHKMGCNGVDNGKLWFNGKCLAGGTVKGLMIIWPRLHLTGSVMAAATAAKAPNS